MLDCIRRPCVDSASPTRRPVDEATPGNKMLAGTRDYGVFTRRRSPRDTGRASGSEILTGLTLLFLAGLALGIVAGVIGTLRCKRVSQDARTQ